MLGALNRVLHRLRHGGARRIVPSFNEQRVGILCFELEGLASVPLDAAERFEIELLHESTASPGSASASILARIVVDRETLTRYGLRVHAHLLPEGGAVLRARSGGLQGHGRGQGRGEARWEAQWRVPPPSPRTRAWIAACREHGTPLLFSAPCDASHYPYANADLMPWFDRPDALQNLQAWQESGRIDAMQADRLRHFVEHGYVECPDAFDPALLEAAREQLLQAARSGHQGFKPGSSQRLEQLHRSPSPIRSLWLNRQCREVIELLFDGPARPVQTLGFVHGSQQDPHQDTMHLTPFPAGLMCGLWIPLEDVQPGSGELIVYPGSHRRPRLRLGDLACPKVETQDWSEFGRRVVPLWEAWSREAEGVVYRPRRGSALIWHENLLHAGSPRRDASLTRCSVVIHYYAADAVAYADSTGEPAMAASQQDLAAA